VPDHLRTNMVNKSRKSTDKGMKGIRTLAKDLLYKVTLYYVGDTQSQLRIGWLASESAEKNNGGDYVSQGKISTVKVGELGNKPVIPKLDRKPGHSEDLELEHLGKLPSLEKTQAGLRKSIKTRNPFTTTTTFERGREVF